MPARLIRRKKETIYSDIIKLFFFFTPFFFGLFYEYAACICAVVLLLLLLYLIDRQKKLSIRFNMLLTALLALLAGYLLTPFWAVDSGMALLGFFKFLPAALFWLLLMQLGPEVRERLFLTIPVSGITMTLLSYPTLWIPALTPYFYASDRLGGFFQYSNSFALFLLLGIIPLAFQKKRRFLCLAGILVLLFGILGNGQPHGFYADRSYFSLAVPDAQAAAHPVDAPARCLRCGSAPFCGHHRQSRYHRPLPNHFAGIQHPNGPPALLSGCAACDFKTSVWLGLHGLLLCPGRVPDRRLRHKICPQRAVAVRCRRWMDSYSPVRLCVIAAAVGAENASHAADAFIRHLRAFHAGF